MASPVVAGTNGGNSGATVQNHIINLPAAIASGDLLKAFVTFNPKPGDPTPVWPAGWTQIFIVHMIGGLFDIVLECRSRVADGTEGASITVTTTLFTGSAHNTYRITGHDAATLPVAATVSTQIAGNPDPPSLTPAGGSKDFLWIAVAGHTRNRTVTTYPTSYTGGFQNVNTIADVAVVESAVRALTAAAEDPDVFTLSATTGYIAGTVAVYPSAAASVLARQSHSMHPGKSPGMMSGRFMQTYMGRSVAAALNLQTMTATAVASTATLTTVTLHLQTMTTTAVASSATLAKLIFKTLTATAVAATATMLKVVFKTLTASTVSAAATLATSFRTTRTLTATVVSSVATLATLFIAAGSAVVVSSSWQWQLTTMAAGSILATALWRSTSIFS